MLLSEWLVQQKEREDTVGALARRFLADASGPLWANTPETFRQYLTARHADKAAFCALETALREWSPQARAPHTTANGPMPDLLGKTEEQNDF